MKQYTLVSTIMETMIQIVIGYAFAVSLLRDFNSEVFFCCVERGID